ncbi:MAG: hypothetical protein JO247_19170 [Chloroflexi bacterium]|nr:hypothetical protein [Chloroflexota bacterium]
MKVGLISIVAALDPAAEQAESQPLDMRCANTDCDLFQLKLEADEVAPTPETEPDRCASCGQPLEVYQQEAA